MKATSLAVFRRVAEAEAKIHGKQLYEVHLHEVGATDSLVDIVGAAICFHSLGIDAVWCSPIELGGGFVYVGAMHDSFPHALELAKKGYNAFALTYRPGARIGWKS